MRLEGGTYLVAGGAGVAGECVVQALLERGATVAIPSRSPERLSALRDYLNESTRIHMFVGGFDSADSAAAVTAWAGATLGRLDGVVASLGGWWEGPPLVELAEQTWQELLQTNLNSHFRCARALLPLLTSRPGGVYVALNGIAAELAVARSGPTSS